MILQDDNVWFDMLNNCSRDFPRDQKGAVMGNGFSLCCLQYHNTQE